MEYNLTVEIEAHHPGLNLTLTQGNKTQTVVSKCQSSPMLRCSDVGTERKADVRNTEKANLLLH